jgi:hypothetical protein
LTWPQLLSSIWQIFLIEPFHQIFHFLFLEILILFFDKNFEEKKTNFSLNGSVKKSVKMMLTTELLILSSSQPNHTSFYNFFVSVNLFKILGVLTWTWSFLTSKVTKALYGQKHNSEHTPISRTVETRPKILISSLLIGKRNWCVSCLLVLVHLHFNLVTSVLAQFQIPRLP